MSTEPVEGTVGTMTWSKGGRSETLPINASAAELHAALARLDIPTTRKDPETP